MRLLSSTQTGEELLHTSKHMVRRRSNWQEKKRMRQAVKVTKNIKIITENSKAWTEVAKGKKEMCRGELL